MKHSIKKVLFISLTIFGLFSCKTAYKSGAFGGDFGRGAGLAFTSQSSFQQRNYQKLKGPVCKDSFTLNDSAKAASDTALYYFKGKRVYLDSVLPAVVQNIGDEYFLKAKKQFIQAKELKTDRWVYLIFVLGGGGPGIYFLEKALSDAIDKTRLQVDELSGAIEAFFYSILMLLLPLLFAGSIVLILLSPKSLGRKALHSITKAANAVPKELSFQYAVKGLWALEHYYPDSYIKGKIKRLRKMPNTSEDVLWVKKLDQIEQRMLTRQAKK